MTALEEIIKEVESMERDGATKKEIVAYMDQAMRMSDMVSWALL